MEFTFEIFCFNDSKNSHLLEDVCVEATSFFLMLIGISEIFWINLTHVVDYSERQRLEEARYFFRQNDVYAYLKVEGTPINYSVAQHLTDDSHDVKGDKTIYGAIFTEHINNKNFNDVVTIIYGHATKDGSMFGTLSNFADKNFFDRNRVITIQTQRENITYEIFAAYSYGDTHLFDTFSFRR